MQHFARIAVLGLVGFILPLHAIIAITDEEKEVGCEQILSALQRAVAEIAHELATISSNLNPEELADLLNAPLYRTRSFRRSALGRNSFLFQSAQGQPVPIRFFNRAPFLYLTDDEVTNAVTEIEKFGGELYLIMRPIAELGFLKFDRQFRPAIILSTNAPVSVLKHELDHLRFWAEIRAVFLKRGHNERAASINAIQVLETVEAKFLAELRGIQITLDSHLEVLDAHGERAIKFLRQTPPGREIEYFRIPKFREALQLVGWYKPPDSQLLRFRFYPYVQALKASWNLRSKIESIRFRPTWKEKLDSRLRGVEVDLAIKVKKLLLEYRKELVAWGLAPLLRIRPTFELEQPPSYMAPEYYNHLVRLRKKVALLSDWLEFLELPKEYAEYLDAKAF